MVNITNFLDSKAKELTGISDAIWDYSELGFKEFKSAKLQAGYLEVNGFHVEMGVAGIPTAFVAEWGQGKPYIGYLGEYDALAGVSQEVSTSRQPRVPGGPGHGCGHNLLGTGALGAALGLKHAMGTMKLPGTIRYYGCPAEELLAGKVYMARVGLFSDLDVAITWHPGAMNTVRLAGGTAMNSVKFSYHGKTAHAAGDPHNGRSALDAVELLNISANYLREHVISQARIHYVITNGGNQPNVVPAEAEVWYYVRAPHRYQVEEIYDRLVDAAKGAALMTGTTFDINFLTGCYEVLLNETLADVMWDCLQKVGPPEFSPEEMEFAQKFRETFDKNAITELINNPEYQDVPDLCKSPLNTSLVSPRGKGRFGGGSTDVGDVSWIVPTVQMSAATVPLACPGHSWQNCALSGSTIGHKGMIVAAKTMALCGFELVQNPELIKKAKIEFDKLTKESPYKSPLPEGTEVPLDQF